MEACIRMEYCTFSSPPNGKLGRLRLPLDWSVHSDPPPPKLDCFIGAGCNSEWRLLPSTSALCSKVLLLLAAAAQFSDGSQ